jgi:uncharacterized cupin superfamily protein
MNIEVITNPSQSQLDEMGVSGWPIWEKEVSSFPWTYDMKEVCYILEGEVTVTPNGGEPIHIKAGDLVTFPNGMSCHWDISEDIRKHYQFS